MARKIETRAQNVKICIGTKAGRPIKEALENAKESIDVITPYMTMDHLNILVRKQAAGVAVNLVTSSDCAVKRDEGLAIARSLVEQHREVNRKARKQKLLFLMYALCFFLTACGLAYGHWTKLIPAQIPGVPAQVPAFLVLALFCLLGTFLYAAGASNVRTFLYSYSPRFNFAMYRPWRPGNGGGGMLVHAKIFVIDSQEVYFGSVNLTAAGFAHNCEICAGFRDPQAGADLSREIRHMIAEPWNQVKPYAQIGKEAYTEPG